MDSEKIKRMLDACYMAKRIRELLPKLPDGVSPAYIHIRCYSYAAENKEYVKVSDISDALNPFQHSVCHENSRYGKRRDISRRFLQTKTGELSALVITKWRRIV